MIMWLYKLIVGCNHDWTFIGKTKIFEPGSDRPYKIYLNYRCTKCNKHKKVAR